MLTNPDDPEHVAEHCLQAAKTLEQWRGRYAAALAHAGIKSGAVDRIVAVLERAAEPKAA